MSYQRITSSLRDRIIDRLKEQFQPRFDELDKLERRIAETAYEEMMGPHAVMMASLPEGWLPVSGSIIINPQGHFYESFKFEAPKRFTAKNHSNYREPSAGLLKICEQFCKDREDLKAFRQEAIRESERVINSVTTVNRLVEVWPEIASVLKDIGEDPQPTAQVPAPILDKLNAVLDLPIEEQQAA